MDHPSRFLELQSATYSPPALLARESCIFVCFESIRCILTLGYILGECSEHHDGPIAAFPTIPVTVSMPPLLSGESR